MHKIDCSSTSLYHSTLRKKKKNYLNTEININSNIFQYDGKA